MIIVAGNSDDVLMTGFAWMMESLKNTMTGRLAALTTTTKDIKCVLDENLDTWKKSTARAEKDFTKSKFNTHPLPT